MKIGIRIKHNIRVPHLLISTQNTCIRISRNLANQKENAMGNSSFMDITQNTPTETTLKQIHVHLDSNSSNDIFWNYSRAPNEFWEKKSNRKLFFEWLGSILGFSSKDDWYNLSADDM